MRFSPFASITRVRRALAFNPFDGPLEWPYDPPRIYDSHQLHSESRTSDWKSRGQWLAAPTATPWLAAQLEAMLSTSIDYAAALLNLPGGGELVFGVRDELPSPCGIEGVICAPTAMGGSPIEDDLAARLRIYLRALVVPWRDEWVRVVPVVVPLTARGLLSAAAALAPFSAGGSNPGPVSSTSEESDE